jgi:hypothetical protein
MQDDVGVGAHIIDTAHDLYAERLIETDQFAHVLADFIRIDIDGADKFQAVSLGDQFGRCAADRPEPVLDYSNLLVDGRIPC